MRTHLVLGASVFGSISFWQFPFCPFLTAPAPRPGIPLFTNACSSSRRGPKPPSPTHEGKTDFETDAGKFCVLPSVILNQC